MQWETVLETWPFPRDQGKGEGNGFGCAHPNCMMADMRINREVEKETSIVSLLRQSLNSSGVCFIKSKYFGSAVVLA